MSDGISISSFNFHFALLFYMYFILLPDGRFIVHWQALAKNIKIDTLRP